MLFGLTRLSYWGGSHWEGSEVNNSEASGLLFRVRQIAVAGRWASLGVFFESGFPLSSRGFQGLGFRDRMGARGSAAGAFLIEVEQRGALERLAALPAWKI